LKDVQLSKLTLQRLQQFFNQKLAAGNSPALVKYLRVVLRIALNEALKSDLIAECRRVGNAAEVGETRGCSVHSGAGRTLS
jgi:hypothetical protein